jgi:hypothetical protein
MHHFYDDEWRATELQMAAAHILHAPGLRRVTPSAGARLANVVPRERISARDTEA